MNKQVVVELLKEKDNEKASVLPKEVFFSVLEEIGAPLESETRAKLQTIYDKKGEGKINYDDLITEQKFVHAVSVCVCVEGEGERLCTCM